MQTSSAAQLKPTTQNLYEILEVAPDSPQEEVYQAFLKAKQTYSADSPALYSIFSKEEADELLRMVEDAYAVLGNPIRRKQYDDKMRLEALNLNSPQDSEPPSLTVAGDFTKNRASVEALTTVPSVETDNGFARTPLSNYKVVPSMEEEIRLQQVFDGTFLQRVRNYKNVDLDRLSKVSRIGRNYLVAVESNDFHSLPAAVFVRGFISQISRQLCLDEKLVVESFMKLFKQSREK